MVENNEIIKYKLISSFRQGVTGNLFKAMKNGPLSENDIIYSFSDVSLHLSATMQSG